VKRAYLLAGSLGLLSLVTGYAPAQAATENLVESAPEVGAAGLLPTDSPKADSTLVGGPVVAINPEEVAQPQVEVPSLNPVVPVASEAAPAPLESLPTVSTAPKAEVAPVLAQSAPGSSPFKAAPGSSPMSGPSIGQVTSVSQLSDVKPTDWAYQAVQSLVEKYGCIVGYPDSTFRGNRAATRYELAAALNACLDVISDRFATKEDLAALKKLQEEFAAELATLRGRVDNLEARTAKLEAQQFSTTTKLIGTATMSFQAGAYGGSYFDPVNLGRKDEKLNATVIAGVILNLNTSFNGEDLLQTSLAFGNNGRGTISDAGLGTTPTNAGIFPADRLPYFNPGQYYWDGFGTSAFLYRLAYTFKPVKDVTVTAGALLYPGDIIDTNSYANSPSSDYGSYFFINNSFIIPYAMNFLGGAGGAVQWNPGQGPFTIRALYLAANAGLARPDAFGGGFLGDPYQASAELEYKSTFSDGKNSFALKAQFTNSATYNVSQNAGGLNGELSIGKFGIWARYGIAGIKSYGRNSEGFSYNPVPYASAVGFGNDSFLAHTFAVGLAYKDLFVPGSMIGAAVGAPLITSGAVKGDGINDATQLNIEAFYRFPVTDNISITPIMSVIVNPNNSSANDTIYQGVLRTTFTF
jgi:hypothetical protein